LGRGQRLVAVPVLEAELDQVTSPPRLVHGGETSSYTLRLSNIGEAAALRVRVCDTPAAGVTITSAPGLTRSGHSSCITISTLHIGAHATYHLTAEVSSGTRGKAINRATAEAANAPSVRSQAPSTVIASPTVTG
jgi:uncharacterized repeat protein (TIGR01451 family)